MMPKVISFSIDLIRDEACSLVRQGIISRQQPIYVLCQHIPAREWESVERELEFHGFLLRDRVVDLMGREDWHND